MNFNSIKAIYKFEMARALRTIMQSILAPVLSTSLYFVVFGAAIGSKSSPKYGDYIIYGNLIILCEGWDSNESIARCSAFIQNLE